MSFTDFKLDPALLRAIADQGFTEPTAIQRSALPPALEGRDVLACAMTGSGKTAAFVLPLLQRLGATANRGATRALILTPTRELAAQVEEHLRALGRHTRVRSATVIGGVSHAPQERALRAGVDVVVATPGRLLDHLGTGVARLDAVEVLVLDEADRMLDMGFLPDVRRILAQVPKRRQTLLFSATLPRPIVALSREVLNDPARLDVERPSAPPTLVAQQVLPVPQELKPLLLLELLRRGELETALVFTRTKHRANRLAAFLERAGIACDRIHGNRSQKQRETALAAFKNGRLQVLVATDIAARGIDVEALPHVVNFDVPAQADDYIHRVGRTARAGAAGDALTFASPSESAELAAIERAVGRRIERRTLPDFDYRAQPGGRFEVPVAERIAAIRQQRSDERARARAKVERQAAGSPGRPAARPPAHPVVRPSARPTALLNHGQSERQRQAERRRRSSGAR
ncbi:MAG TPA: DEAD/DEAH box helicase [Thermoanaerobaculia bacterium]|nr:DEAD/DEAH box helicase [Thermoanaerobaculia bacterium]